MLFYLKGKNVEYEKREAFRQNMIKVWSDFDKKWVDWLE